jgi:hypothetical protein
VFRRTFIIEAMSLVLVPAELCYAQRSRNERISGIQEVNFRRLKIEEVQRQTDGNVKEEDAIPAQERVFTDLNSWRAFWSRYGKGKIPEIDFKTSYVAAVFLGPRPNPGYGVKINKISYDARKKLTLIHVKESLPKPAMSYIDVVVYPADIVAFPAMAGRVQFVQTKR